MMAILCVTSNWGDISSILLLITGLFFLFIDPSYGLDLFLLGFINLIINTALQSSNASRRASLKTQNILNEGGAHIRITEEKRTYFCPRCLREFSSILPNSLSLSCQIPLKKR